MANAASSPSVRRVFAVAAGLFVIWGVALWLYNSLFFKLSKFFALGPTEIAWSLALFHIAYVLLALPAVAFHRQFGFKLGVLAGLSVFGIGAFLLYLAIIEHSTLIFLASVIVIGACGSWLDTSLNPLAAIGATGDTIVKRLNLAHAFSGAGLFIGDFTAVVVLGKDYNLYSGPEQWVARPYVLVGLGAILLAFLVEQIALPDFATKGAWKGRGDTASQKPDLATLSSDRGFLFAAAALASYCAVLTILWTANYKYVHTELPGHLVPIIERGWLWFAAGRVVFAVAMRWVAPARLLALAAIGCLAAVTVAGLVGGETGWIALAVASFFLALTYPTVFGIALARRVERLALAAGLMVIAAGLGNVLSSLVTSYALDALNLAPRLVVLGALPFEAVVLAFALRAGASRSGSAADRPA
jgi:MFS transporter, FHS family, L-fucose permease